MGNWNVTVVFDASKGVDVEADNAEEAIEKAYDAVGNVTLCHQCTDDLEVGDAVFVIAYSPDGEEHSDDRRVIEIEKLRKIIVDREAEVEALRAQAGTLRGLLASAREFIAAYVNNSFFGPNARRDLAAIDAALADGKVGPTSAPCNSTVG